MIAATRLIDDVQNKSVANQHTVAFTDSDHNSRSDFVCVAASGLKGGVDVSLFYGGKTTERWPIFGAGGLH